jgi:2-succinyl-5-enolpyruvyl-6-hydroxy-3-cyclohexene-1-carboxylate synthase
LIVLTADRPESWINQQDGQAIEQKNIYANIIARSYHLRGELFCADDLWHTKKVTNEAIHISVVQSRPVHINISFAEPLYNEDYAPVKTQKVGLYKASALFSNWEKLLKGEKKIIIVVGQLNPDPRNISSIEKLHSCSAVVLSENLANLPAGKTIFNASEVVVSSSTELNPEIIIYIGGSIVSKQIKKFLRSSNASVIRVQINSEETDTFQRNISIVQQSAGDALETLADYFSKTKGDVNYAESWKKAIDHAIERRNSFMSNLCFSDLKVYEFIAMNIPTNSVLHFGNSTPVRYAQIFTDRYATGCKFYSNRGTSGIDGATSTMVGFAYGDDQEHFLISGDLGFQYDSNAFFNKHLNGRMKVVVINNSGGNIFRVIDGPREQKELAQFFETSLQHEFSNMAEHFNLNYFSVRSQQELEKIWKDFIQINNDRPAVLEIFTEADISANTFKEFYNKIQL